MISRQLIKACIKGKRKAQFEMYQKCFPVLMSVCMRYKKNEEEAAEILNAGFLKILDNLKKYRKEVPFEAWIKRIMINTIIDEYRKNRKVKELITHTDFSDSGQKDIGIDYNAADQYFDAQHIESIINLLPPTSKKVFNLFAIDGYSHPEIAEVLGMSIGTSKWHLSFARKKIKELMVKDMKKSRVG